MIVEWWQLVILAAASTFAGVIVGRRSNVARPIPVEDFTIQNVVAGDLYFCRNCQSVGVVTGVHVNPILLTCSCGATHPISVVAR